MCCFYLVRWHGTSLLPLLFRHFPRPGHRWASSKISSWLGRFPRCWSRAESWDQLLLLFCFSLFLYVFILSPECHLHDRRDLPAVHGSFQAIQRLLFQPHSIYGAPAARCDPPLHAGLFSPSDPPTVKWSWSRAWDGWLCRSLAPVPPPAEETKPVLRASEPCSRFAPDAH